MKNYDGLKLENQLCFPFYVCSKEIVRHYKPYLDKINLTYTQYITMMVLWEEHSISSKDLGNKLYLDSGTLTPVLKKLEQKQYITRQRDKNDERNLIVSLTSEGEDLKEKAVDIPNAISNCIDIEPEEAQTLWILLHKVMGGLHEQ